MILVEYQEEYKENTGGANASAQGQTFQTDAVREKAIKLTPLLSRSVRSLASVFHVEYIKIDCVQTNTFN